MVFRHPGMGLKKAEIGRVMAAINRIQEAGVAVNSCFIVGSDGETKESLQAVGEFLLDLGAFFADVQLTIETPFPGTPLRARLKREGRLLPDRGWDCHTLFDVCHQPDRMSVGELETGFEELLSVVFDHPQRRRRERIRREIHRRRRVS